MLSEGLLILELDRLLKPGGIFASSSFQVSTVDDVPTRVNKEQANNMCWSVVSENDKSTVWQKTSNHSCYLSEYVLFSVLFGSNIYWHMLIFYMTFPYVSTYLLYDLFAPGRKITSSH